ncbi:MAG: HAMP domain-containing sensor histidine kinase [Oscillospiraceae bacterium]
MSKIKGIRKRWMVNSISTVLLIVLLAVTAFSAAMASFYYNSIASGLEIKVKTAVGYYTSARSELEYRQSARTNAETFDEKNTMELQFINVRGAVDYSSYGLTISGSRPGTPDIDGAIADKKITPWTGNAPETGERVMAVSAPVIYNGDTVVGVMRLVTSLRQVDLQVVIVVAIAMAVGLAILMMVYFSNLYFVRSIVEPVGAITDTAKRIAAGSYGIQMGKQYDDEIGDLIDAINDMSQKINQSEKMKSEFISSVSHELRTPLTAINGWAETLMSGEVREELDFRKGMGIIVSEARRLTNMVEELLEFSRIEDGRFTLSMEPMDVKAELEDAVYTYREFFRKEGITLTHTDCEEEFPPFEGDPERLRQVFCNLLDNAAKHGGSGKKIDTSITKEDDEAVIRIRDYGPGIPEEELPHVKYKFYKGSSKARGSGIGLAVCEEIITRHDGTLTLSNAEGGGCVVTIRLRTGT